jgi:hypothetical protein
MRTIRAPIFTSCFARVKLIAPPLYPVSIARVCPRWAGSGIRRYPALAPPQGMAHAEDYLDLLANLNPLKVYAELGAFATLLCWEAPGWACHRRAVAEWLEAALGVQVLELGFPADLISPWHEMPVKGQDAPWEAVCDHCQTPNDVSSLALTHMRCVQCGKQFDLTLQLGVQSWEKNPNKPRRPQAA